MSAAVLLAALQLAGNPTRSAAQSGAANSRTFEWTAPGDDGTNGRASRYELRYSRSTISDLADSTTLAAWWSGLSNAVPNMPVPSQSGNKDAVTVSGLTYGATYYFIIRTVDDAGNWSPYSNVATVAVAPCDAPTTTPRAPTAQNDSLGVLLSWSPPQDSLATSVEIYRGASVSQLALLGRVGSDETSYRDTGVRSGITYVYALAWSATCGNGPLGSTTSIAIANPQSTPPTAKTPPSTLSAYPNPASGPLTFKFTIEGSQPQAVHVRLYDLNGHWIADLADGTFGVGETVLTWNRQTRAGDSAAPGYYEALGTIGPTRVRQRLVLIP